MENSAFVSATYFIIYSTFLFYQQSLTRNFKGSSQAFLTVLTFFAFGSYIAQIIYFIYYGWTVSWIDSLLITLASIIIGGILGSVIERAIGGLLIVYLGFLAIPYCGYMMFKTIPIVN